MSILLVPGLILCWTTNIFIYDGRFCIDDTVLTHDQHQVNDALVKDRTFIEFGRGSGAEGLETIRVGINTRKCVIVRRGVPWKTIAWERTVFELSNDEISQILKLLQSNEIRRLRKKYIGQWHDGIQWVLLRHQNGKTKSSYFDNKFPKSILKFSDVIDKVLDLKNRPGLEWEKLPRDFPPKHDDALWDSIR